jgi:HNH endonuclease
MENAMTKEEVMTTIKECVASLGHIPSTGELETITGLTKHDIRRTHGTYRQALTACGLEGRGSGHRQSLDALFKDWAGVVRRLGKIPTVTDYDLEGAFSSGAIKNRFGSWTEAPEGILAYARRAGLEEGWKDVVDMVLAHLGAKRERGGTPGEPASLTYKHRILPDQPFSGRPMMSSALIFAPINESGVLIAFGMVAQRLGFGILRAQPEFPDCEAVRELEPNRWQRVRIEFEYESRNFLTQPPGVWMRFDCVLEP